MGPLRFLSEEVQNITLDLRNLTLVRRILNIFQGIQKQNSEFPPARDLGICVVSLYFLLGRSQEIIIFERVILAKLSLRVHTSSVDLTRHEVFSTSRGFLFVSVQILRLDLHTKRVVY